MRLKSIELIGFKSFPDRTLLDFNSGVTVVVGPNGSGKSNISDAIRWVLGELSAKSVRGTKMEDVIFAGSDKRKPLPFAEVSLTIDNTANEESGRIDSEYDEVVVTRRCYRSGESEYQINRKPVRLRDIAELFMNTGVGKTGYSIIGQGKIAEIVSQKSEERRTIFEEAAGISKFRYRKTEAERKLASVDENLVRLGDIFAGLDERVGPLEKEAEKARKYLDIYEQKKRADIQVWLYDLSGIKKRESDANEEYDTVKNSFDMADRALVSLEEQNEKLFGENQQSKLGYERISSRITEYRAKLNAAETDSALSEHDLEHINEQIKQTNENIRMRNAASEQSQKQILSAKANTVSLREVLGELELSSAAALEKLEGLRAERAGLETEQDTIRAGLEMLRRQSTDARVRKASISGVRDSRSARFEQLEKELGEITAGSSLVDAKIKSAEKNLAEYSAQTEKIKARTVESDGRSEELKAALAENENERGRITLDRMSRKQRIDTLRRMDELFEGYANSVKAVMKASESGRLRGICGPVSRLISVEKRFATAIETAAGAAIQNVVVEDESSAKAAIGFLKETGAGRATFCPLTSIRSSPLNMSGETLERYRGYIGVASELVECEERYREVVGFMLGRTVVFDNLDHAADMAKATGYRVRIVTLDGQQINPGGSFTGGSVKRDTGMLTRGSEIAALEAEAAALEAKLAGLDEKAAKLASALDEVKKAAAADTDQLSMLERLYSAENTQLQILRSHRDTDLKRIETIKAEEEEIRKRESDENNELSVLDAKIAALEASAADMSVQIDEKETKRVALSRDIAKCDGENNALTLKIAEQKKDIEASELSEKLAAEGLAALKEKQERDERMLVEYGEKAEEAKSRIALLAADRIALEGDIDTLQKELDKTAALELSQDSELARLRTAIKEQSAKRENLFREYNRLETRCQQISSEQDKLTAKLWDEYELTYSAACELGYPVLVESERSSAVSRQNDLRSKLRSIGNVNLGAVEEYKEVSEKHAFMKEQLDDLGKSKTELCDVIGRLDREMCERFTETVDALNISFNSVFRELFGGGSAELRLTDPTNVLESGIEINVAPPGKVIKSMSLLSGGEQSFVAIALFFAILNINPTPFCVLDEIEAALDDVNVIRFADYAKRYSDKTQFVIITHRRGTMERADTIYGVTMPERGTSKVLTLDVSEAESKLGVKI